MVRLCVPLELDELARFAYECNQKPESSCVYCFKGYDAIRDEFSNILRDDKMNLFGDYVEGKLQGILALWIDEEKQTADCIGPFALEETFVDIALRLFQYASSWYDRNYTYKFAFNKKNENYLQFVHMIQAEDAGNEYELNIIREDYVESSIRGNIIPFLYSYREPLVFLHDKLCQGCYISGDELIQSIEHNERRVYLATYEGTLIGYSVLRLHGKSSIAGAEILAIDKKYMGIGYEELLLNTLLREGFADSDVTRIYSIVEKHNASYMDLFVQSGFHIKVENCSFQLKQGNVEE